MRSRKAALCRSVSEKTCGDAEAFHCSKWKCLSISIATSGAARATAKRYFSLPASCSTVIVATSTSPVRESGRQRPTPKAQIRPESLRHTDREGRSSRIYIFDVQVDSGEWFQQTHRRGRSSRTRRRQASNSQVSGQRGGLWRTHLSTNVAICSEHHAEQNRSVIMST
jgi:hypothetical protein